MNVPHPEDFTYRQETIDQAKRMKTEELLSLLEEVVLELRGTRRSLKQAMGELRPQPWGSFVVLKGETTHCTNSGVEFIVKTPYNIRVEIWPRDHEAVLEKLAELSDESR